MPTVSAVAARVLLAESEAIRTLATRLDDDLGTALEAAVELIASCRGRVVVTGIGKSGAIGRKIASTLASTGTPALFVHAAEALHGDLGMVAPGDVLLALSYSGRSDELLSLLPGVAAMKVPVVALTGARDGFLARHADLVLDCSVEREACPLNLAPTTSTTAALALGDALAVCLMERRGFGPTDFVRFHPGGTLGRGALRMVGDLMRSGERMAVCEAHESVKAALEAITDASAGAVMAVDEAGTLCGYLTDGDVRRLLLRCDDPTALLGSTIEEHMTRSPLAFTPRTSALDALKQLQTRLVDDAPVVDENGRPVGWLDVQELLRAGLM